MHEYKGYGYACMYETFVWRSEEKGCCWVKEKRINIYVNCWHWLNTKRRWQLFAVMCVCVLDSQRKRANAGNELWILVKNCSDGGGTTKLILHNFTFKHEYYWHDGRWWRSSSSHSHSLVMYDDGILADSYTLGPYRGTPFSILVIQWGWWRWVCWHF